ncbi:family 20 glycosylhydrolase [Sphingobacterium sp. LRF_L2]|uniref:family 20 glycosylhydrolase n=1 Tax=Sphingobacterium sp. LRF_L2 TaxID=3369421 RepID=UPI003F60020B
MTKTKGILKLMALGLSMLGSYSVFSQEVAPVALHWHKTLDYNGVDKLDLKLVLKNVGSKALLLAEKDLWFNAIFPISEKKTDVYEISNENGNLFRIRFADGLQLAIRDSLEVTYTSKYPILNVSNVPNGFYLQSRTNPNEYLSVSLEASPLQLSVENVNNYWSQLYMKNASRQVSTNSHTILPTPSSLKERKGKFTLRGQITYCIDPSFEGELPNLEAFVSRFKHISFVRNAGKGGLEIKKVTTLGKEAYKLYITKKGIVIEATDPAGVFYAIQSLQSLLGVSDFEALEVELPILEISDEPRFAYRGFMLDIARNFKDKSTILKYLDLMARFKLNTFHFHFIDDEGWRIAISSLPELTEIGANRTPEFLTNKGIQPAYGSGAEKLEKDFLTREDFIEILRYAKQRHITVVPEIETPGHARASIKAMEVRYHRYMEQGNRTEAERYLLHDFDDHSVYSSAQYWTDNVMNVALPSVYSFIGVVLDEFKSMYTAAGLKLNKVSLGGDEVPSGAWEHSPKIKSLMDSLQLKSVYEVWPYYIKRVNELCEDRGLQMAGWEEMGMVNRGNGMEVNEQLASTNIQLDVWNNLIGGGQEDLTYRLANAGYQTAYISANNNYFDMAWDTNFAEPGLKWATYADLYQSYTFLPANFFGSIHQTVNGSKYKTGYFNNKVRLNEKGKSNLLGVKGGLWAETVATEDRLDYMVFPRFFALAERAWAPEKSYESDAVLDVDAFNRDYSSLLNKIGFNELPKLASSVKFRLPGVGVKEEKGKLYANTEYPGFNIYYTEDGSSPALSSIRYTDPIKVAKGQIYNFVVIDAEGRKGVVSVIQK